MTRAIIKIRDRYFEWSTVTDAPEGPGMTIEQFRAFYRDKYGWEGSSDLAQRLIRVEEFGHSWHVPCALADMIGGNRAGDDGKCLTVEQIYDKYVLDKD